MALTHILTDGSETGLTASGKINTGFIQNDASTAGLTQEIIDRAAADTAIQIEVDANTSGLATEITDRTNADIALQTEIDAIETGSGLDTDGTYIPNVGTNYLDLSTDLYNSDTLLDTQIKVNTDAIIVLNTPPDYADLNPVPVSPAHNEGRFFYNSSTGTMDIMGPYNGIIVSPGHGEHLHVVNNSGSLIEAGMAVRIAGVAGGIPQIVLAQADTFENARVVGITVLDIPDTTESAVAVSGVISFDTSLLAPAGPYYLSDTVPGTYTKTAPAIRTQIGGVLVSDATLGKFRVDIAINQITPAVLGGMKGLDIPLYNVTAITQDIVGYTITREVVTTVNATTGEITLPSNGDYRVHFTASITFPSAITTRTIYLELYDVTNTEIHYTYKYNVPRDATEASLSFNWTLDELANNVHKMRVRSNVDITTTFDDISFDIESISIN